MLRLPLLPTGLREHCLSRGAQGCAVARRPLLWKRGGSRLSSHHPFHRRRFSRALRRERRANARGRRPDLLVRLLPRSSRARPPESEVEEAGRARRGGANAVHGSPDDSVDPLWLQPRARPWIDDRDGSQSADRARGLLAARAVVGRRRLSRGRLHGEHLVVVRIPLDVHSRRRSDLPVQLGRRREQAAVLPDRDVADPSPRRR